MASTLTPCPHKRRFDLCGDHIAAIVLERLTWWWRRGTMMKHGVEWRAKPRGQLAQETRLTSKQVRMALELLKARNLIETSQHLWVGANYMHYRLLPRALVLIHPGACENPVSEAILAPVSEEEQLGNFAQVQDHMAGIGTKVSSVPSKEGTTETLVAGGAFSGSDFSGKDAQAKDPSMSLPKTKPRISPQSPPQAGKSPVLPKAAMTAAEIIASKSKTGVRLGRQALKTVTTLGGI